MNENNANKYFPHPISVVFSIAIDIWTCKGNDISTIYIFLLTFVIVFFVELILSKAEIEEAIVVSLTFSILTAIPHCFLSLIELILGIKGIKNIFESNG